MNRMTVDQFSKHTGWNIEKIRNFLRERVLPYEKSKGRTYICLDEMPENIKSCYGALTIKAWKRKLPDLPQGELLKIFRFRQIVSCGEIRREKYYKRESIISTLELIDGRSDYEQLVLDRIS